MTKMYRLITALVLVLVLASAVPASAQGVVSLTIDELQFDQFPQSQALVTVRNENGVPIPGVTIAFAYTTATPYIVGEDFQWNPPAPRRADIVPTRGGGEIEHVQGSVVEKGEPGGVTVYVFEPEYSSDFVTGAGALADHTGLYMVFQLRRTGVEPLSERLAKLEARIQALEAGSG